MRTLRSTIIMRVESFDAECYIVVLAAYNICCVVSWWPSAWACGHILSRSLHRRNRQTRRPSDTGITASIN